MEEIGRDLASVMLAEIRAAKQQGRNATFIVPVARWINSDPRRDNQRTKLDCRDVCLINRMNILTDDDQWIDSRHPLSFKGFWMRSL